MAREGEKRSHIRKRKKGCLTGCLTNILLVLGVAAAIFVGAHVLGFVKTDSTTGASPLTISVWKTCRKSSWTASSCRISAAGRSSCPNGRIMSNRAG